jgi:hypothetical protein
MSLNAFSGENELPFESDLICNSALVEYSGSIVFAYKNAIATAHTTEIANQYYFEIQK